MATFEEASRARDRIADALLDGRRVHSVGIKDHDGDYSVGVTASGPVEIPKLPSDLAGVSVEVAFVGEPVTVHERERSGVLTKVRSLFH